MYVPATRSFLNLDTENYERNCGPSTLFFFLGKLHAIQSHQSDFYTDDAHDNISVNIFGFFRCDNTRTIPTVHADVRVYFNIVQCEGVYVD